MEEAFGSTLTPKQLWALTKFAKHVRLRARNNAAFNNFANAMFPYARFQQVQKTRQSRSNPSMTETYPGLKISVGSESVETQNTEDDEG